MTVREALGGAATGGEDYAERLIRAARARGFLAFTPSEFRASEHNRLEPFESLLISHVAEHMTEDDLVAMVNGYVDVLRRDGRLILISPQEAGFRSDSTYVEFMDFAKLAAVATRTGFDVEPIFSFPFHAGLAGSSPTTSSSS